MDFQVGQEIWVAPYHKQYGVPGYATVKKVGRLYVEINYGYSWYRVSKETGQLLSKDQGAVGMTYASKEVWDELCLKKRIRDDVRKLLSLEDSVEKVSLEEWKRIGAVFGVTGE